MEIETSRGLIEFFFEHCQIEITGRCNMRCAHCRAWGDAVSDMPLDLFKKSIDFIVSESDKEDFKLTISGGEPFLHPDLIKMIGYAKERGIENVIITTNGSLVTLEKLNDLKKLNAKKLKIQISIDNTVPEEHSKFRGFPRAFELAMGAFDNVKKAGLSSSLRASITPRTINQVEALVKLAIEKGADRVGIGSVIPAGRGKLDRSFLMTPGQKKNFLEEVARCKVKYPGINVVTEDPLKFALKNCPWEYGSFDIQDSCFYGGCTAGISSININSEGIVTPCSVLLKEIVDLKKYSIEEAKEKYVESEVIHKLFERDFKGKCGNCKLKRLCGGCRAVAEGVNHDYLGEDVTCFYKPEKTN